MGKKWREVRTGVQFINLDYLGTKTIKDTLEKVFEGKYRDKPQIIGFLAKEKKNVAINTTSCELLEKVYGDDFDDWVGKKVSIKAGKANFGKSKVDAVIISPEGK